MTVNLLGGFSVLDLTDPLGVYATKLLADLGARVIRVECPDDSTYRAPYLTDGQTSLFHAFMNQKKQIVQSDTDHGLTTLLDELSPCVDAIVWSSLDGTRDPIWPAIARRRGGDTIVCTVTPFGSEGPYGAFVSSDLVTMALGGYLSLCGYPDEPVAPFGEQSFYAAGLHAAFGTAVALHHMRQSGVAQAVDVSAHEAIAHALENAVQFVDLEGIVRGRIGDTSVEAGTGVFACADGYVCLMSSLNGALLRWRELVDWLLTQGVEAAKVLDEERWLDGVWRRSDQAKEEFRVVFESFSMQHHKRDLFEEGQRRRVNIAPLLSPADLVDDPQLLARDFFVPSEDERSHRPVAELGLPFRIAINSAATAGGASRHTSAPSSGARVINGAAGPLANVRIIDFTWMGVGPFATKFLADFGADVIKIESAERIDPIRLMRPAAAGEIGVNRSGYFANRNTSKRSITLDLKIAAGRETAIELIRGADIVINNFSPDVMMKLGLGYETLSRINPSLIYVDMPLMGMDGPHRHVRGYGAMMNAMTGLYAATCLRGRRPCGTGTNYPDHVPNPLHAALAMVAALIGRDDSRRGAYIEVAQFESSVNVLGPWVMASLTGTTCCTPVGNEHSDYLPQGVYRCDGDTYCAITVRTQRQWDQFASILGRPEWVGLRVDVRRTKAAEIEATMASWLKTQRAQDAALELQRVAIPAGWVQDASDVLADEQLCERKHWVYLDHPDMGHSVYDAPVARLSRTPAALRRAAPRLGEHTEEVCRELLGVEEASFRQLQARQAFGEPIAS